MTHENDNPPPDPRQLDLFPGFVARPTLAKCRKLTEAEELERLETINPAPALELFWRVDHGE